MHPYYKLKFKSTQLLKEGYKFPEHTDIKWNNSAVLPKDILSTDFMNELDSYGFYFNEVRLFYRTPETDPSIAHIDLDTYNRRERNIHAINWVIGGNNSKMFWYKDPETAGTLTQSRIWSFTYSWNRTELTLDDSVNIGTNPVLVRTDVPHCVDSGNTTRWCISIRHDTLCNSWQELVEYYMSKNLI